MRAEPMPAGGSDISGSSDDRHQTQPEDPNSGKAADRFQVPAGFLLPDHQNLSLLRTTLRRLCVDREFPFQHILDSADTFLTYFAYRKGPQAKAIAIAKAAFSEARFQRFLEVNQEVCGLQAAMARELEYLAEARTEIRMRLKRGFDFSNRLVPDDPSSIETLIHVVKGFKAGSNGHDKADLISREWEEAWSARMREHSSKVQLCTFLVSGCSKYYIEDLLTIPEPSDDDEARDNQ